ncbi:hypothetical protein BC567DRAFT_227941 [Phyllosticta citribraziliensis]
MIMPSIEVVDWSVPVLSGRCCCCVNLRVWYYPPSVQRRALPCLSSACLSIDVLAGCS